MLKSRGVVDIFIGQVMIREFNLAISENTLNEVYARVERYPWQALPDNSGWDLGADTAYMKELCRYWVSDFDWYRRNFMAGPC